MDAAGSSGSRRRRTVDENVSVVRWGGEERYWHLQNMGDLLQPARSDAVGALLVFLHLLEGETEPIGQLLLGRATSSRPPGFHPAGAGWQPSLSCPRPWADSAVAVGRGQERL